MHDFLMLLPEFILSIGATIVLLVAATREDSGMREFARWFSVTITALAGVALASLPRGIAEVSSHGWLINGPLNVIFGLVFIAIIAWVLLAGRVPESDAVESYSLVLFAGIGMVTLARTSNLAGLFLGIELLSIALYALIAFSYQSQLGLRGGAMYLTLAGFASGFLVFGLAFVYAVYGTLDTAELSARVVAEGVRSLPAIIGFGLFLIGVAFKLAAAPCHMWAAEVYEAAPGPVSGLIASASKGAVIAAFIPFLFLMGTHWQILWLFSAGSMLIGNLLALREQRVKRILAYSSIAHIGYLLVGFMAGYGGAGVTGVQSVTFYVVAYAVAILGAFVAISLLEGERTITLRDLRGVAKRSPVLAACLLVFVMSLAGLPPTIGIWGKIFLFQASVSANYLWLPLIGLVASAVGIYYYLRIIVHVFMMPSDASDVQVRGSALQTGVLVVTAAATVILSVFPDTMLRLLAP
jgi:NADH-quinone oxidoreductase subunit N